MTLKRRTAALGTVVIFGMTLGFPAEGQADPGVAGADIQKSIAFRESAGLRADDEYVSSTFTDPASFPDLQYGVPLSAADCLALAVGGLNSMWRHSGTNIGTGRTETYGYMSTADAGLIAMSAPSGPDNLLFGVSEDDIRTVGGYVTTASQNVGDYLCRSGRTTGFWCGNITLEDRVKDVDGTDIEHQWVVNFDAVKGDSGAPYFTTSNGVTLAWGIHSDSTSASPPGAARGTRPWDGCSRN